MSVKRDALANYLGQGWTAAMGLAFVPLYIRYLGIEAYGVVGLFALVQIWLTLLDLGMTPTLNREMAKYAAGGSSLQFVRDLLRSLELIAITLCLLIFLGVWAISDWLARDWLKPATLSVAEASQAIAIMAFVVATRFVESVYRGALFGLHKQVWFNILNAVFATLRWGGGAAVVALLSSSMQAFFLTHAVVSLVSVVVLARKVHTTLPHAAAPPRFSMGTLAPVGKFAAGMAVLSVLTLILTQTDKLLLSRLLPLEDFGYYTLAASVSSVIYILVVPLSQAAFPRLVELVARGAEFELARSYHASAQVATVLTAPVFLLLALHGAGLVFLWSGDAQLSQRSESLLAVLALGAFLSGLMYMPSQAQLAYGWTGLLLKSNAFAAALLVAVLLWVIPRHGAIGAAWVWVTLNASYVLFVVTLMHRRILVPEKWQWYWKDVIVPGGAATAWAVGTAALAPATLQNRSHWLFFLTAVGIGSLLLAALAASAVRPVLIGRLRRMLTRMH